MKDLDTMEKKQEHLERQHSYCSKWYSASLSKVVFILGLFLFGCSNSIYDNSRKPVDEPVAIDAGPLVSSESIGNPSSSELHNLWPDLAGEYSIETEMDELGIIDNETEYERYRGNENVESIPSGPIPSVLPTNKFCNYIAKRNVNCRESDHVEASLIAILMQGEGANLLYVNPTFTHGKFELLNSTQCWIYLGIMDGPTDPLTMCNVYVVDAPPLSEDASNSKSDSHVCSDHKDQASCLGAGCSWEDGGPVSASYCH
jgi:hypothetical protein